ncbi:hypothetical protein CSKR_111203 [Clonorchis sinensis]|uniref:Uncharacterized protein n=1 Tax=Clonorchis sinensis TaxID=79923 RepID=A0A3R7GU20_CLOSI|nr:hypothetical protein CSKR_111203 [Clonorchis sinensis]
MNKHTRVGSLYKILNRIVAISRKRIKKLINPKSKDRFSELQHKTPENRWNEDYQMIERNLSNSSLRPVVWLQTSRHQSRLGQPGNIPALVIPSGGTAARHREGVTADGLKCDISCIIVT